jgi:predicted metal-dependent peptidase
MKLYEMMKSTNTGFLPAPVPIPPEHKQSWTKIRAAFLIRTPYFAHLLYTLLMPAGNKGEYVLCTRDIPTAATDGRVIAVNPDFFFKLTTAQSHFVLAHEVLHAMFAHPAQLFGLRLAGTVSYADGERLPFVEELYQYAADYVINAMLVESRVGAMPDKCLFDTSIATHTDSVVEVYRRLFEKSGGGSGGSGQGGGGFTPGKGQQPFDAIAAPGSLSGKDPASASAERQQAQHQWKVEITAAMASAKARGLLPATMERAFGEFVEPQVDWKAQIVGAVRRTFGSGGYDWMKADRRLITRDQPVYAPSRSGHGCGLVVFAVDTSGSIGDKILEQFFGEMSGALGDLQPELMKVVWCDAKVHRVDDVSDPADLADVRRRGAVGGGGTDFRPPFDWVEENDLQPDGLVYLTDGYGSFPNEQPAYPVVWGSITDVVYPWGSVVRIPRI